MPDTCATCRFFGNNYRGSAVMNIDKCRRYPPKVFVLLNNPVGASCPTLWEESRQPYTQATDWCGEWQSLASTAPVAPMRRTRAPNLERT